MILPKKHPCPLCGKVVPLSGMLCLRGQAPKTADELKSVADFVARVNCGCYRPAKKP